LVSHVESGLRFAVPTIACAVKHRLDLVLVQRALEERIVLEGAVNDRDLVAEAQPMEVRLRDRITHERDDVRAAFDESLRQVRTEQSGRAGDEHLPIGPCE